MAKAPERVGTAPQKQPPKKTLVGILGLSAALMLMTAVPHEESSRTVAATPTADGQHIQVRNISGHEYLKVYLDIIGVATACDGLTRDQTGRKIKLGDRFTEAQCSAMLEASLTDSADHVMRCTPGLEGHDGPKVASALLAHNIGWPTYCKSSISRMFNAHAYRSACDRFPLYDMTGGRHLPALKARRKREQYTCITGKLPYA